MILPTSCHSTMATSGNAAILGKSSKLTRSTRTAVINFSTYFTWPNFPSSSSILRLGRHVFRSTMMLTFWPEWKRRSISSSMKFRFTSRIQVVCLRCPTNALIPCLRTTCCQASGVNVEAFARRAPHSTRTTHTKNERKRDRDMQTSAGTATSFSDCPPRGAWAGICSDSARRRGSVAQNLQEVSNGRRLKYPRLLWTSRNVRKRGGANSRVRPNQDSRGRLSFLAKRNASFQHYICEGFRILPKETGRISIPVLQ